MRMNRMRKKMEYILDSIDTSYKVMTGTSATVPYLDLPEAQSFLSVFNRALTLAYHSLGYVDHHVRSVDLNKARHRLRSCHRGLI
jgi:hypothetical protein